MALRFAQLLSQREDELHALLKTIDELRPGDETSHEVSDFKDLADEQTLARVDRANAQRIESELQQLASAQRRLAEHRYGFCQACDEPIDLRRLLALPATAYCAQCQTQREGADPKHHRAY
jgi:DnaK suppressor protein